MLQQMQKGDFVDFIDLAKPKQTGGERRWHILICEPNREETASRGLASRGFAPYLPVVHKQISAGRTKKRDVPRAMFTCYLFLPVLPGIDPWDRIKAVPGVFDVVTINAEREGDRRGKRDYATLPNEAVDAIRRRERSIEAIRQGKIATRAKRSIFEIGQNVHIPVGQFDRLAGKISKVLGKNVEVLLEMEFMGRRAFTVPAERIAVSRCDWLEV
ncbi:transcription antitermination factor NusG [Nitrobacteraceae bacterium AZCC 2161]